MTIPLGLLLALGTSRGGAPEDLGARVDAVFADFDRLDHPGCAVGIVRGGELVLARGYGAADPEHRVPFRPDTPSYVGSVAKQFVALLVLLLEAEKKLSIEDELRKHLPELPDYGETVRVRHLLHHTSGLRDYLVLAQLRGLVPAEDRLERGEALDLVFRQRSLNFAPEERFSYSNTGYLLLSEVVERITGRSFTEVSGERLLRPLGMDRSRFLETFEGRETGVARGFRLDDTGALVPVLDRFHRLGPGGAATRAEEAASRPVPAPEPAPRSLPDVAGTYVGGRRASFFRLWIDRDGLRGAYGSGRSFALRARGSRLFEIADSPGETLSLVVEGRDRTVALEYRGSPAGSPSRFERRDPLTEEEAGAFVGEYRSEELDATWRIRFQGGWLRVLVERPAVRILFDELVWLGSDILTDARDTFFSFRREGDGRVNRLVVDDPRASGIVFER